MTNIAKQHIKISPDSEIYFDAIWEYSFILSEESQNALMDYGFRYLGLEAERIPTENGVKLWRIRSSGVRKQIVDIFRNPEASNSERCFLVGRLGCRQVGYSEEEILEMIDQHNRWLDYSKERTEYHVRKLYSKLR
jgi:hypothetical protein